MSYKRLLSLLFMSLLFMTLHLDALAQHSCTSDHPALTPAPLQEEWAVEWWMPRHEQKLVEEGRESAKILLIGDSITHGWENTGKNVWPEYFGEYTTYNIGYSGDRTENVLWRFEHGEIDGINPKIAVVMIGTNNTGHRQDPPECTAKGVEMIVGQVQQKLPDTRILLLAIFPRDAAPDGELRQLNSQINDRINALNEEKSVTYLNINDAFLDDDGNLPEDIMPDLLHPNDEGYKIWAEAMKPTVDNLINR
jgi:beta-glucosidase